MTDARVSPETMLRARLGAASGWPAFVASMQRKAALACPFCGGHGEWVAAAPGMARRAPTSEQTSDHYYAQDGMPIRANQRGDVWSCVRCGAVTGSPKVVIAAGRPLIDAPVKRRCEYCGRKLDPDGRCPACGRSAFALIVETHESHSTANNTEDLLIALCDEVRRHGSRTDREAEDQARPETAKGTNTRRVHRSPQTMALRRAG